MGLPAISAVPRRPTRTKEKSEDKEKNRGERVSTGRKASHDDDVLEREELGERVEANDSGGTGVGGCSWWM